MKKQIFLVVLLGLLGSLSIDADEFARNKTLAEQGNVFAQYELAGNYRFGRGVPVDHEESFYWYRQAAEQGYTEAQYILGYSYQTGQNVTQDYSEAMKWYRLAAEAGQLGAQYELANMFYYASGTAQNLSEAIKWYRQAAERGHNGAQNNLGVLLERGEGIPQNYSEALVLYRKSAEQGNTLAQYNHGEMIRLGLGITQNLEEAYVWFNIAATSGLKQAIDQRDILSKTLSTESIVAAQERSKYLYEEQERRSEKKLEEWFSGPSQNKTAPKTELSNFVKLDLPKDVSLELPSNWVVLSDSKTTAINSVTESGLSKAGVDTEISTFSLAATFSNDDGVPLGILNVRYYPELEITQTDVIAATNQDVADIDAGLQEEFAKSLEAFDMTLTSWAGTKKTTINGTTVLISEYQRKAIRLDGNYRVRLVRVLAGSRSVTVTVSYLESAEFLRPITDQMINSLDMGNTNFVSNPFNSPNENSSNPIQPPAGNTNNPTKSPSKNALFNGFLNIPDLLIAGVIALFVSVLPALLIRYRILKRPMSKGWAVVYLIPTYFFIWFGIAFHAQFSHSEVQTRPGYLFLYLVLWWAWVIIRKESSD